MKTIFRPAVKGCTIDQYLNDPETFKDNFLVIANNVYEQRTMLFTSDFALQLLLDMFHWDGNGSIHKALTPEQELSLFRHADMIVDNEFLDKWLHIDFDLAYFDDGSDQYQDPLREQPAYMD